MRKFFRFLFRLLFLLVLAAAIAIGTQYKADIPVSELEKKYANAESQFVEVDGTRIHYRDEGQGPPLLLLHGTGASLHTWDGWAEQLQLDFRIIRLDLPAYGLTGPTSRGKYLTDNYVAIIHDFLEKLEVDTLYLAGNSLGGNIAWNYAFKYPEQVKKMILVDPSGFPQNKLPQVIRLARNPFLQPLIKYITPRYIVANNLKSAYADPSKVNKELIDRYLELSLREGNREAFVQRAGGVFLDQTMKLNAVTTPTLIMWGEKDSWIPVDHARKFNEALVNSQILTYPEAGHVPMEEIPAKSAQDARNFFKNDGGDMPELN